MELTTKVKDLGLKADDSAVKALMELANAGDINALKDKTDEIDAIHPELASALKMAAIENMDIEVSAADLLEKSTAVAANASALPAGIRTVKVEEGVGLRGAGRDSVIRNAAKTAKSIVFRGLDPDQIAKLEKAAKTDEAYAELLANVLFASLTLINNGEKKLSSDIGIDTGADTGITTASKRENNVESCIGDYDRFSKLVHSGEVFPQRTVVVKTDGGKTLQLPVGRITTARVATKEEAEEVANLAKDQAVVQGKDGQTRAGDLARTLSTMATEDNFFNSIITKGASITAHSVKLKWSEDGQETLYPLFIRG